ncbi:alpha-2,8-polysialyltransferase family protein [Syntrophaceticus schinkii]|nr:alpha-2,8-polysialyltransferase family protein [Syntrophaceticus schinkii]
MKVQRDYIGIYVKYLTTINKRAERCWLRGENMHIVLNTFEETKKFINSVFVDREIKFIASSTSHWHALGIDAEINSNEELKQSGGIIFISPHPKDGFLIDSNDFICSRSPKIKIAMVNPIQTRPHELIRLTIKLIINKIKNKTNTFYLLSPMTPKLLSLRLFTETFLVNSCQLNYILIDEGIGTYLSSSIWKRVQKDDKSNYDIFGNIIIQLKNGIFRVFNSFIIYKCISVENRFLFNNVKNNLRVNATVRDNYNKLLLANANQYPLQGPVALFVTNPYSEYNYVDVIDEYNNIVKKIVQLLIKNGFKVIIKPHPREDPNKYQKLINKNNNGNIKILNKNKPIEKEIVLIKPSVIVGFMSTALLTAKVIFNIPAFTAVKYFF